MARVARLEVLARALDAAVRIPGTNVRVGLDPIIGLVPGVGDLAGAVISAYVILAAAGLGASAPVLMRMLLNVVIDTVVGSVPVAGDLFDVAWRSNMRNVALLRRHVDEPAAARSASRWVVGLVLVAVLVLLAAGLAAAWWVLGRILHGVTR